MGIVVHEHRGGGGTRLVATALDDSLLKEGMKKVLCLQPSSPSSSSLVCFFSGSNGELAPSLPLARSLHFLKLAEDYVSTAGEGLSYQEGVSYHWHGGIKGQLCHQFKGGGSPALLLSLLSDSGHCQPLPRLGRLLSWHSGWCCPVCFRPCPCARLGWPHVCFFSLANMLGVLVSQSEPLWRPPPQHKGRC